VPSRGNLLKLHDRARPKTVTYTGRTSERRAMDEVAANTVAIIAKRVPVDERNLSTLLGAGEQFAGEGRPGLRTERIGPFAKQVFEE